MTISVAFDSYNWDIKLVLCWCSHSTLNTHYRSDNIANVIGQANPIMENIFLDQSLVTG